MIIFDFAGLALLKTREIQRYLQTIVADAQHRQIAFGRDIIKINFG